MKTFRPLSDYVLVKLPPKKEKTEGGILLPETAAAEKPQQGHVVAVGPGRTLESGEVVPMHVKVGAEILFGAYAGIEMKIQNQNFLVIRQDDILLHEVEEPSDAEEASSS